MLPETGKISLDNVRNELNIKGSISLGQIEVRKLAGQEILPQTPRECDYYFETIEDFRTRRDTIISENNNDLSQKTFGFGDGVTNLEDAFYGTSITSTPKMIFARNITSFSSCFYNCKLLKSISSQLFIKCYNAVDFVECFRDCHSLTSIPQGLFDNCPNATNFDTLFGECKSLTEIPKGLFDKNVNVTNFGCCFMYCFSLKLIPQGLFDKCVNVTDFWYCFNECTSLITIPQGLFDKCPNVTDFSWCFSDCSNITSSLPDAWNKAKFPKVTDGTEYAYNCTKAANYSQIPADFK